VRGEVLDGGGRGEGFVLGLLLVVAFAGVVIAVVAVVAALFEVVVVVLLLLLLEIGFFVRSGRPLVLPVGVPAPVVG